jgi:hypothetical protein
MTVPFGDPLHVAAAKALEQPYGVIEAFGTKLDLKAIVAVREGQHSVVLHLQLSGEEPKPTNQ